MSSQSPVFMLTGMGDLLKSQNSLAMAGEKERMIGADGNGRRCWAAVLRLCFGIPAGRIWGLRNGLAANGLLLPGQAIRDWRRSARESLQGWQRSWVFQHDVGWLGPRFGRCYRLVLALGWSTLWGLRLGQ